MMQDRDFVIDAFPINASRFKDCRAYEIDLDGKIDFFQDILPRLRAIKIEENFACVGKELILTIVMSLVLTVKITLWRQLLMMKEMYMWGQMYFILSL